MAICNLLEDIVILSDKFAKECVQQHYRILRYCSFKF